MSDRQWRDLLGVARVQLDNRDRALRERHADEQRVAELFARLLNEAG